MTDSEKLDLILSEMQDLKQRTTNIETSVTDIKLTLDNEKEMLAIRVNTLDKQYYKNVFATKTLFINSVF